MRRDSASWSSIRLTKSILNRLNWAATLVLRQRFSAGSIPTTEWFRIRLTIYMKGCPYQSRARRKTRPLISSQASCEMKRSTNGSLLVDLNRLNSSLLQTFLAVADAGQISAAARRLHLSQPAVTAQIRRLEADLDTTLFIPSAHGLALTAPGVHLPKLSHPLVSQLQ